MLGGSITLWQSGVAVARGPWPDEELQRQVLGLLAGEAEPHPVREWLLFLARTAVGDVARRLEQAGYLTRARGWVPWRSARWVPVDPDWAFAALLRVRSAVDRARPVVVYGAVLAGLAIGCGLGFRLDKYLPPASRSAEDAAGWLDVSLRHLIAGCRPAAANSWTARSFGTSATCCTRSGSSSSSITSTGPPNSPRCRTAVPATRTDYRS